MFTFLDFYLISFGGRLLGEAYSAILISVPFQFALLASRVLLFISKTVLLFDASNF